MQNDDLDIDWPCACAKSFCFFHLRQVFVLEFMTFLYTIHGFCSFRSSRSSCSVSGLQGMCSRGSYPPFNLSFFKLGAPVHRFDRRCICFRRIILFGGEVIRFPRLNHMLPPRLRRFLSRSCRSKSFFKQSKPVIRLTRQLRNSRQTRYARGPFQL